MAFLSAAARAPLSFLHTPGVALAVGSLYPGLLAAAPGRGLFSSAHGSAVRKINTCERKRAELLSPKGARIIAGGVAAQRRNLRNAKKSFGTPLKTAVTACLGVGLAEDGPASA